MFNTPFTFLKFTPSGGGLDPDAAAFLTATGITDPTISSAINDLVVDLKADSLWSKFYAIYPFVGGTSTTCKYNLIDPQDTDAGFRITFNGGWTFSSSGVTANGTTAYGDSYFNPYAILPNKFNFSLGYYGSVANPGGIDLGVQSNDRTNSGIFGGNIIGAGIYLYDCWDETYGRLVGGSSGGSGFWIGSRTSNNNQAIYKNGTSINTNTQTPIILPPAHNYYIGASNKGGTVVEYYSSQNFRLAFFGNGLTSIDVSNFNSSVTTFQTALGRQV
jgi:hypothetical protein